MRSHSSPHRQRRRAAGARTAGARTGTGCGCRPPPGTRPGGRPPGAPAARRRWRRQRPVGEDRLAEDAGGLGQRHRRRALERGAVGQRGVVVGVAQLVGEGVHASIEPSKFMRMRLAPSPDGMQKPPPTLPARGPASTQRSSSGALGPARPGRRRSRRRPRSTVGGGVVPGAAAAGVADRGEQVPERQPVACRAAAPWPRR